ncbi:hypothetical protein GCM10011390_50120 [Aureimonas endophytica]|uniref:DUF4384 domain-containing protein n=1 Tax=Aureimonas endophytica TaxID=2027858 RepID=A0A917A3J6_9HYPH|nr:DUF4384 domain-containing protein [Aureimonas endophytica]GGE24659.1 hypothetical protein GCM10011390_50120 [Aureimonas endophytica]
MRLSAFRACLLGSALLAVSLAVPARAQSERDLSVVQAQALSAAKPAASSLTVLTLLDRFDATYALGEKVRLGVKTNEDAYVTVFNIGPTGKVTQLFPNAYQRNNAVRAGEVLEIPAASSGASITVSEPVGGELIKIIATSSSAPIVPEAQLQGGGAFKSLSGDVEGLMRNLAVVGNSGGPSIKVATTDQIIKTIATRPVAATSDLVVPAAPASQPSAMAAPATFPLLLTTDRQSYKVGESLTLAAIPTKSCYLTVMAKSSSGQVRMIFPSKALPASQVNAGQTVMLSGANAPQDVVATGPGTETVTALCTAEARQQGAARSSVDAVSEEEKSAFDRDLAVIAQKPAGTVGFAQIALTVVP